MRFTKKTINLVTFGIMLAWISCALSCATLRLPLPPKLENQVLDICDDSPGFCYQYFVCEKKFLGICTKQKAVMQRYDFNDAKVRADFKARGFKLAVIK